MAYEPNRTNARAPVAGKAPNGWPAWVSPRAARLWGGPLSRLCALGVAALASVVSLAAGQADPAGAAPPPPRILPDYSGVVLPPNIAPLNFRVEEPGSRYRVSIRSTQGQPILIQSRSPSIRIPPRLWRSLLQANRGAALWVEVQAREQTCWKTYGVITNRIAPDEIDGTLVYRLLKPLYSGYQHVGIYQRDLTCFVEQPVLRNQGFGGGCLNCHTFLNHGTDTFALHIRSQQKLNPLLLVQSNEVTRVDKTAGYMSWHPSGRLLAFSANQLSLFFHTVGETRDVFDANSDLGILRLDSNRVVHPPALARPDRQETWPAWSPDGRHLYFCSAPKLPVARFRQVRYDLMRVSYDLAQDRWGEPETLVAAADTGLSAAQPRVSPDGRWVLFCLAKYGNFPVYQPSSDLHLLDLTTRQTRRLDLNSDQADSWHCFSSNGRWIVFSSKRLDGLFARPHFSYFDPNGRLHKPFLLPQEDPAFYDSFLKTFNVPELVREPIRVPPATLGQAVFHPRRILAPTTDRPQPHREEQAGPGLPPDAASEARVMR